jgi:hypothetical protein
MNIIKDSLSTVFHIKNKEEFIDKLLLQVLTICREDKSFTTQSKIKKINEYKIELQEKDNKLNILLEKSNKIKEEMEKQLLELNENNTRVKQRLLLQLGSEI